MSRYAHITRCLELSAADLASAIEDRASAKELISHLARVSRPADGAPKVLLLLARLASESVDWIDGALRVEMIGDPEGTHVEVLTELGLGMHERVFPSFRLAAPLDEFARAVERVPHLIAPLQVTTRGPRRLVLTASTEEDEELSVVAEAPMEVTIGDDSLYGAPGPAPADRAATKPAVPSRASGPQRAPSSSRSPAVRRLSSKHPAPASKAATPAAPKRDSARPGKKDSGRPAKNESLRAAKADTGRPPRRTSSTRTEVPKAPPMPRVEGKPAGSAIARVALARVAVAPRGPAKAAVEKRASRPPRSRASDPRVSRPPLSPTKSTPPPKSARAPRPAAGEAGDDEGREDGD